MFTVALPLALAFIMFTLGMSLTPADFGFSLRRPHPLLAGVLCQVVLLPLVAFLLIRLFSLPGELGVGVLVLACCPGGITSNVMTRLARGDVALSISFTALASLITTITLPLILTVGGRALMGTALPAVSITGLGLKMFVMTTLPVLLGVLLRQRRQALTQRWERPCEQMANGLFVLIANLTSLGPVLLLLNLGMLAIGTAVAQILRLPASQVSAVAIESGFQNGTVGIAVGALLVGGSGPEMGLSAYSLPSGVYGVLMMITILPYLVWRRSIQAMADPSVIEG
ncbi:bile acid:sodium symporter family protein [Synechococcus sp. CBW1006]|uniref:bile acid:sodium symporter family protein n=1 Tax=Synechococcus sp. CBW1006 TaxID=1353138 RepID=UPI0018CED1E2|nr:bile acid:sodium symporter [Synechococcus sp. CBW1006]QPN65733.1 bile acid:sodium symporter family protein [Synechococcus sp. CBW1006]